MLLSQLLVCPSARDIPSGTGSIGEFYSQNGVYTSFLFVVQFDLAIGIVEVWFRYQDFAILSLPIVFAIFLTLTPSLAFVLPSIVLSRAIFIDLSFFNVIAFSYFGCFFLVSILY